MRVALWSDAVGADTEHSDFVGSVAGRVAVILDSTASPVGSRCPHSPEWFARRLGVAVLDVVVRATTKPLPESLMQAVVNVMALHASCMERKLASPVASIGIVEHRSDEVNFLVLGKARILTRHTNGSMSILSGHGLTEPGEIENDAKALAKSNGMKSSGARWASRGDLYIGSDPEIAFKAAIGKISQADIALSVMLGEDPAEMPSGAAPIWWEKSDVGSSLSTPPTEAELVAQFETVQFPAILCRF